ncbi:MAG: LysM peptidoglycan-binding domain-containing protein, partial [Rhodospirillales bacterium]|nr:LysM peptidoglycan-binding domain-containing protein [Rhodospirillales bacterium]
LSLSGQATPGAIVQLYLDNKLLGRATTGDDGGWAMNPEQAVAPGLYTLRADMVDATGKVIARVSLPFARSELATDLQPGDFVMVQPGNSLWRLARRSYGEGLRFSVIYEANKEQIKDPDLIYPGQIFTLPKK